MSAPITHPAPAGGLRTTADYAQAFWLVKEQGDEEAGRLLLEGFKAYKIEQGNPEAYLMPYLEVVCADRLDQPGSLYNTYDRELARNYGYTGNLTELQTWGRALRGGKFHKAMTPAQIAQKERDWLVKFGRQWLNVPDGEAHPLDSISESEITEALLGIGLSELEVRKARLSALEAELRVQKREAQEPLSADKERSYELLRARAPNAPRGSLEAERLVHQAFQEFASADPTKFDGVVRQVQVGQPDGRKLPGSRDVSTPFTEHNWKPMRRIEYGKQYAHDFVTGNLPRDGQVYEGHHLPLGENEARSTVAPHVFVFAATENHIPQPGGPVTAHNRRFSTRNPDVARYALQYNAVLDARWEAHMRQEPDPYPAHLSMYVEAPRET